MSNTPKELVEFELDDGGKITVEVNAALARGTQQVARRDGDGPLIADKRFQDALDGIKPALDVLMAQLQNLNNPSEITIEFGVKFAAKAGAVFASVDSEANFKVEVKWINTKAGAGP